MLDRDILTVSLAPRDNHEAQVQFALERGIPAILGIISTQRLPFPSNSFDMAHCSRCLIPWTEFGILLDLSNKCHNRGGKMGGYIMSNKIRVKMVQGQAGSFLGG